MKKQTLLALILILFNACVLDSNKTASAYFVNADGTGTLTDNRDGQSYKTVTIGSQVWMAQNLNYGTMIQSRDTIPTISNTSPFQTQFPTNLGDSIGVTSNTSQQIQTNPQQNTKAIQKFCFNDSAEYCSKYGALYQWHEIVGVDPHCDSWNNTDTISCNPTGQIQGICPKGWHIPSQLDWQLLFNQLGDSDKTLAALTATTQGGNNLSGMQILLAGSLTGDGSSSDMMLGLNSYTVFWTSTASISSNMAWLWELNKHANTLITGIGWRHDANSLRCLKD